MFKVNRYFKLFIIINAATSVLQGAAAAQQVHINAQAQDVAAQGQNQQVAVQQAPQRELAKTALIVGGAILVGALAGSGWPIALGVGYGIREVCGWFNNGPVVNVRQAQRQQAQAQANAQVVNNIIQGPDHQDVQKMVISIKAMRKGLHNFRNESYRNMEHIDRRFDDVGQGQAELLRGQAALLNGQQHLGEGQEQVLNRVNYMARMLEQQQQAGR
jgi:hypothetical protein